MDLLCDNMVEEILVRLPEEQHLRRASAACRRYGDIIRRPGFATRHRELHSPLLSGGVVLHGVRRRCPRVDGTAAHVRGSYAFFLPAGAGDASASSSLELDLAGLLPSPTDRELAYLLSTGAADPDAARRSVFIVHSSSSAGLLLCCRGYVNPVHYYVCDPVARRCVALPELPWPPAFDKSGMLSVAAGGFQVVLFEKRGFAHGGGHLDLEVFSSDSGEWAAMRIPRPQDLAGFRCFAPPHLRHDGAAAYWLGFEPRDRAVVYGAADHSIRLIPVPRRVHDPSALNRFVGERRGGASSRCGTRSTPRRRGGRWCTGRRSRTWWPAAPGRWPPNSCTVASSGTSTTTTRTGTGAPPSSSSASTRSTTTTSSCSGRPMVVDASPPTPSRSAS